MCGIAGVVRLDGGSADAREVKPMGDALAHRGPDGEGFHVDGPVGLAHRRLAIIDLSDAGRQPMFSADGQVALVYNGEVYNFRELRQEYARRGYAFRSRTDTEVLLAGYLLDGIDFVGRCNGMFAFALWDARVRRLFLVRDRYGVKPLYFARRGGTLLFGSEVRALLAHPEGRARLNAGALVEYFTFQNLLGEHTLFEGVSLLSPGTIAWIDPEGGGALHRRRYWDFDFTRPDAALTAHDAEARTLDAFTRAVERQMVSDVPVGSYLSGGMDSGSITAVASRGPAGLSTFTCGFQTQGADAAEAGYDEREAAEELAARFGTEHFEQVIAPADLAATLPTVVRHLEDLRVGMSYPNYLAARLASRFVSVCLSGAGGDELFGGYPWRYYRVLRARGREDFLDGCYAYWQRLVKDADRAAFFQPAVLRAVDPDAPRHAFRSMFLDNPALGYDTPEERVANALWFESKTFLHGLLIVGDRLAMAHSLEERVPFLDDDLVAVAQSIPVRLKLGSFERFRDMPANEARRLLGYVEADDGKQVLRGAVAHLVPRATAQRRKQGFSAPEASWTRGPNRAFVERMLLSPDTVSAEWIRPETVRDLVRRHMDGRENHRLLLWSLLSFEEWCRAFLSAEL
ncbi:MAG TPA: asparagine synthase (glutamine-hydrolyzing) [Longimicrobium sp.]|jgi:asparagine synthase (glutamine-hydrolysing)